MDKYIKTQRKRRYKKLKKLFKARDEARKYVKRQIKVKTLDSYFDFEDVKYLSVSSLTILIYRDLRLIFKKTSFTATHREGGLIFDSTRKGER